VILVLAGCGGLGLDELAGVGAEGAIAIAEVSPRWGPPEGGTAVTITGEGFVGDVLVQLGNAEVSVDVVDEGTLVVTTPYAGVEATVDVTVTSDLGTAKATGAFTYSEDEPPDTGGTSTGDTDPPVGGDEGTGAGILYDYTVVACTQCFTDAEQLTVTAEAYFHDGVNGAWDDWLPAMGDCVERAVIPTEPASRFVDVGDWVYLNSRSKSVSLQGTSGGGGVTYLGRSLTQDDWDFAADFDLSVPEGGAWGAFDVANAVETPEGFDSVTPSELLETSPQRAFTARVSRGGGAFSWSPYGGDGSFVVGIDVYSAQGAPLGSVTCRDADNGRMTIPASALSGYPVGSLLAVSMYRYQTNTFDLPTGATGQSIASAGFIGTGTLSQ
jgi:hypothetical protein